MPLIHLQIMVGPGAGRRLAFDENVITFGRAEDRRLVVSESYVSRHHGELRFEADRWVLHNVSAGGTRVNRRQVKNKPRPLGEGDVVSIGAHQIFRVSFGSGNLDQATAGGAIPDAKPGLSGRAKLWIGIGIYNVLIMAVVALISLGRQDQTKAAVFDREFTPAEIRRDVTRRAPPPEHPDPARSDQFLQTANESYIQRDRSRPDLYRAYRAFQQALAWSGKDRFEDATDVLRFADAEEGLVDLLVSTYQKGYVQLRAGQNREAIETFGRLAAIYPDHNSELFKNIERHRNRAVRQLDRRRR